MLDDLELTAWKIEPGVVRQMGAAGTPSLPIIFDAGLESASALRESVHKPLSRPGLDTTAWKRNHDAIAQLKASVN